MTLHYPPPGDASALGEANQWCARPELLDEFRQFIEIAPATVFARRSVPARVEINFGEVD